VIVGEIFAVYSSKGGVGKSFIAANLAASIVKETRKSALLIDCGISASQDIASYLNLDKVRCISKLLPIIDSLKHKALNTYAVPYRNGISVLSLMSKDHELLSFDQITVQNISNIFQIFKSLFDFIIIDIGITYGSLVENLLTIASEILMPFDSTPLSLIRAANDLDFLRQRNFPHDTLHVVLNRSHKNMTVTRLLAEERLRKKLTAEIPFDQAMDEYFKRGFLYPLDLPEHSISKALQIVTHKLLQAKAQITRRKSSLDATKYIFDVIEEEERNVIKLQIHTELLEVLDLKKLDMEIYSDPVKYQELQYVVREKTIEILDRITTIKDRVVRELLAKEILQESLGLGLLEDLLEDPTVTEIMVNRWDQIYVERQGLLSLVPKKFLSEKQLLGILERVVAPLGRRIDTGSPMVDARLKDGSRVNAVIPPLAVNGANLTIRKFGGDSVGINELISYGSLNSQVAEFLKAAVKCRLNVIVSGGTGSGKTTLLNILSSFIPSDERIITIEDSAELQLRQPHVIILESRPPNIEGSGEVTIRDLVRNSLRMRPDRIVVGECRAGEALDMLQAMNTGHDGSLTTLHANSTREALSRLETLVLFAGYDLPLKAIREQIVGAIDIIVQLARLKDGSRKIIQVSEVTGMESDIITMGDVYCFKQERIDEQGKIVGSFVSTGYTPRCLSKFEERGLKMPREIFWTTS
jgi:septum site-determining protein MinD